MVKILLVHNYEDTVYTDEYCQYNCIPDDHDMRVLYQYHIRDHITDAVGAEM